MIPADITTVVGLPVTVAYDEETGRWTLEVDTTEVEAALADAGEDVLAELWTEACGAWVPVAVAPVRWVPPAR